MVRTLAIDPRSYLNNQNSPLKTFSLLFSCLDTLILRTQSLILDSAVAGVVKDNRGVVVDSFRSVLALKFSIANTFGENMAEHVVTLYQVSRLGIQKVATLRVEFTLGIRVTISSVLPSEFLVSMIETTFITFAINDMKLSTFSTEISKVALIHNQGHLCFSSFCTSKRFLILYLIKIHPFLPPGAETSTSDWAD